MSLPERFTTLRLTAERIREEHTHDIHRMLQDPEQMAMLGGVPAVGETAAYMTRSLEHWEQHGFGVWILRDRLQQVVAGRVLLRHLLLDSRDEIELGYSLLPCLWGKGLAAEAALACLSLARERLHVASVVALTRPDHLRSQRVMMNIGMHYESNVTINGEPRVLFRANTAADG